MERLHWRSLAVLFVFAGFAANDDAAAQDVIRGGHAGLTLPAPPNNTHRFEQLETQVDSQAREIAWLREQVKQRPHRPEDTPEDPLRFHGKWDHGLWYESVNGDFRANIGGRVEQDYVWSDTDRELESAIGVMDDGVFFRRARIHGAGRMYGVIDLFAEFEAAPVDNIVFQDMWAQLRDVPVLGHIRAGHVKVPLGLENSTSAKYITFMERSAVHDAFQQEYDPGVVVWNHTLEQDATWAVAALRLDPRESGIAFGNGRYSGVGRVSAVPLSNQDDSILLHVGGGFRYDHGGVFDPTVGDDVVRFGARPELRNTLRLVDTGPLLTSGSSFVLLEGALIAGPCSLQAEYIHTTVHDAVVPMGGPNLGRAEFDGYYVYASYLLSGETRPYDRTTGTMGRIVPTHNVRPGIGQGLLHQGAWEVGARYSHVDLNDTGVTGGVLQTLTASVTWYLNPNTKILLNYIRAARDIAEPSVAGNANLLGMRLHIAF